MTPIYADSRSDASLADSLATVAETYRRHLPPGELRAFAVEGLDRLGLPVEIASFGFPKDHTAGGVPIGAVQFDGFGYGLTREEATVGALGELTESAHCERDLAGRDFVLGSYDEMVAQFGRDGVCDPLTLCLPAGSAYDASKPLEWTEAVRYEPGGSADGERVFVPIEFACVGRHQMRGRDPMIVCITNGLGAGLSREQALAHGLLELLQRDGNCTTFRALDQGTVIELDEIADPSVRSLFDRLQAAGLDVSAKLASTEFGLVNAYVVGRDRHASGLPVQTTACGEASHLDRERALRKAAVEFAAARSRKAFMHGPLKMIREVSPDWYLPSYLEHFDPAGEEPRALRAMVDWSQRTQADLESLLAGTVFSHRSTVKLSDLPTVAPESIVDPRDRCEAVAARLAAEGLPTLVMDYTPPGQDEIAVVKAIVPGLEGETMSYGRLGERGCRRLLDRGVDFVGHGKPTGSRLRVLLTEAAEERLGGPVWFDPEAAACAVGDHYALYREPASHAVPLAIERGLFAGE